MTLRDRKTNNFVELWCPVSSGDLDIWVSSTSFQKIDVGWPQQPPTEKVPKFNLIFQDSYQKYLFSKHQYKAQFRNLDNSAVISSDFPGLRTFAASMISTDLTTSVASRTSTASISSKNLLILIVRSSLAPKLWKSVPFCGMDHQKSNFLLISVTLSFGVFRRLLRPADFTFFKTGWWNSNVHTS